MTLSVKLNYDMVHWKWGKRRDGERRSKEKEARKRKRAIKKEAMDNNKVGQGKKKEEESVGFIMVGPCKCLRRPYLWWSLLSQIESRRKEGSI